MNSPTTPESKQVRVRAVIAAHLESAKDSAEVLEAMRMADAALHYAKLSKAANETQGDCMRIIARAEIRMALELNKAQAEGVVATQAVGGANIPNGPRTAGTAPSPATLPELGIPSQRASEWRKLASVSCQTRYPASTKTRLVLAQMFT